MGLSGQQRRELEDALIDAFPDTASLEQMLVYELDKNLRAIAEEEPSIFHFCGHGLEDGSLLLEDDGGNDKPVAPSVLSSLSICE